MKPLGNRIPLVLAAGCLVTLMAGATSTARAEAGGTIKGKVQATPAKYLPDTVVYLKKVPGKYPPATKVMDQKGMKFDPHILTVNVGDTVRFPNNDTVAHNVFSPEGGYNFGTFKPGEVKTHVFDKPGPYTQLCSIHPEMLGYVFVNDNPYVAIPDSTGSFTITGVPPGTYQIAIWNAKLKAPDQSVTVVAGKPAAVSFQLKR